jgi:hypothetical protein
LSLEIGAAPAAGIKAPVLRLYPEKTNGFSGQIALASLTRPGIELALASTATTDAWPRSSGRLSMTEIEAVLNSSCTRPEKIDALTMVFDRRLQEAEWRANYQGEPKDQTPGPEDRWRVARQMAQRMVDAKMPPTPAQAPPNAPPQFPLDDEPPSAQLPRVDLPDFETRGQTP